jgi:hypothetical protein
VTRIIRSCASHVPLPCYNTIQYNTNIKASINIYMAITFDETRWPLYNKCYHSAFICSVVGSTSCITSHCMFSLVCSFCN